MSDTTKAERTRARLIQIAAERFASDGYHGTSYTDLVRASGLSKGAFYFHFPSKLELALEAYRTKQNELLAASLGHRGDAPTVLARLTAALEARAAAYAADRSLRILPRLSTDFARDPELAPVVHGLHEKAVGAFADLVREGQATGEIRSELDAEAVARTIFATIVGMDEVSERECGGRDLERRSRDFITLLVLALAPSGRSGLHGS
jgi:AcrR family transcriptional regulator